MIVSRFQAWAENAPPPRRADGVSALARALLYSELDFEQRQAAVVALAGFLDDPSPLVRRALADAFASAIDAPRAIVLALAEDESSIASIVLSRSPVLGDAELIDCAAAVDSEAQAAIASRRGLSALVAAALAEAGSARALVALAENLDADLPGCVIKRMIERHGDHADLRAALLARGNLPIEVRFELVAATARALVVFVERRGWAAAGRIERATREATEKAAIAIAASDETGEGSVSQEDLGALAVYLRNAGRLTPAFALRALLSGNRELFNAMLSNLSGMSVSRVQGLAKTHDNMGFAALYRKSGLPAPLLPAFRIALGALRNWDSGGCDCLYLPLVIYVHDQCAAMNDGAFDKLLVLLRRFEAEAARDEARTQKLAALAAHKIATFDVVFTSEEVFAAGEAVAAEVVIAEDAVATEVVVAGDTFAAEEAVVSHETFFVAEPFFGEEPSLFAGTSAVAEDVALAEEASGENIAVAPGPHVLPLADSTDGAGSTDPVASVLAIEQIQTIEDVTVSRVDCTEPVPLTRPHWINAAKHTADVGPQSYVRPKRNTHWINVEADLAQFETELHAA